MKKPVRRFASPVIITGISDIEKLYAEGDGTMVELRQGETLIYSDDHGIKREVSFEQLTASLANTIVDVQVRHRLLYSKAHQNKTYAEVYREYLNLYPILKAKITGAPVLMEVEV